MINKVFFLVVSVLLHTIVISSSIGFRYDPASDIPTTIQYSKTNPNGLSISDLISSVGSISISYRNLEPLERSVRQTENKGGLSEGIEIADKNEPVKTPKRRRRNRLKTSRIPQERDEQLWYYTEYNPRIWSRRNHIRRKKGPRLRPQSVGRKPHRESVDAGKRNINKISLKSKVPPRVSDFGHKLYSLSKVDSSIESAPQSLFAVEESAKLPAPAYAFADTENYRKFPNVVQNIPNKQFHNPSNSKYRSYETRIPLQNVKIERNGENFVLVVNPDAELYKLLLKTHSVTKESPNNPPVEDSIKPFVDKDNNTRFENENVATSDKPDKPQDQNITVRNANQKPQDNLITTFSPLHDKGLRKVVYASKFIDGYKQQEGAEESVIAEQYHISDGHPLHIIKSPASFQRQGARALVYFPTPTDNPYLHTANQVITPTGGAPPASTFTSKTTIKNLASSTTTSESSVNTAAPTKKRGVEESQEHNDPNKEKDRYYLEVIDTLVPIPADEFYTEERQPSLPTASDNIVFPTQESPSSKEVYQTAISSGVNVLAPKEPHFKGPINRTPVPLLTELFAEEKRNSPRAIKPEKPKDNVLSTSLFNLEDKIYLPSQIPEVNTTSFIYYSTGEHIYPASDTSTAQPITRAPTTKAPKAVETTLYSIPITSSPTNEPYPSTIHFQATPLPTTTTPTPKPYKPTPTTNLAYPKHAISFEIDQNPSSKDNHFIISYETPGHQPPIRIGHISSDLMGLLQGMFHIGPTYDQSKRHIHENSGQLNIENAPETKDNENTDYLLTVPTDYPGSTGNPFPGPHLPDLPQRGKPERSPHASGEVQESDKESYVVDITGKVEYRPMNNTHREHILELITPKGTFVLQPQVNIKRLDPLASFASLLPPTKR